MQNKSLYARTCVPCEGGMPPLSAQEATDLLAQLGAAWGLNEQQHLYKKYTFKNFAQAMQFANKIAAIAEMEKHHPDLYLAWGKCTVELWTHSIKGLSENDFIVAAKIEQIYNN